MTGPARPLARQAPGPTCSQAADPAAPAGTSSAAATAQPARPPGRVTGPTPTNPRGAPPRPIRRSDSPQISTPQSPTRATPAGPLGRLSDGTPWHATSDADGRALAQHVRAKREYPVLVITTPREDAGPLIDADDLHRRVREVADVVVLHNGPASWALADAMPPMTQIYGGAGRVYPIDLGWLANPCRAPIRFCWPGDDPKQVADQLEDDAYASANLAGLAAVRSATATAPDRGTVQGALGRHHVLLRLDGGGQGALLVDELFAGIEPERLLKPGHILTGRVVRGHMLSPFSPDPIDDDPIARTDDAYAAGDVVLARVVDVTARSARALLHPRVNVSIRGDQDESDLRNLIAVDDVVTLTITGTGQGQFTAELADADAPSVACIPVLPGGPPWLVEDDLPTSGPEPEPAPTPAPASEVPAVDSAPPVAAITLPTPVWLGEHARIAGLNAEINSLKALLDQERRKTRESSEKASRARAEAQKLRRKVRSLEDQHQAYRDRVEGARLFSDPAEQLRYEIEQTWLRRTPEPERARYSLPSYRFGPRFLESVKALEGVCREKVLDVIVELLTDRARDIPGRELHQLRDSESSPSQRVRADGARAWRCALQVNTPSARRLHFWKLTDGDIELDSVATHDSVPPIGRQPALARGVSAVA